MNNYVRTNSDDKNEFSSRCAGGVDKYSCINVIRNQFWYAHVSITQSHVLNRISFFHHTRALSETE